MLRALAVGMSLSLILSGCGRPGGREVLANVLYVRGNVTVHNEKKGAARTQSVTTTSKLSVGDRLETLPDAMAALSLIPGIFIQMGGGTEIVIEELRVRKRGDAMVNAIRSRVATLRINRGVIRASLPDVGSAVCILNMQTGLGTLVAQRGALLSVRLTNETLRVLCVDGVVQWRSASTRRVDEIQEGYFREYDRDAASTDNFVPGQEPVSDDAEAQRDVTSALEAAAGFEEFILRARNAPDPKSSHPVKRKQSKSP